MPIKFNNFTQGPSIATSDFIVGYNNTSPGGERRWTVQQLINLVKTAPAPGTPVQIVQAVKTDTASRQGTNPGATWLDVPGLSQNMRLETNNPSVRIQAVISASTNNSHHPPQFRIVRVHPNFTQTVVGVGQIRQSQQTAVTSSGNGYGGPAYSADNVAIDFLDRNFGGTVGQVFNYKLQWWVWATSVTAYINRGYLDANAAYQTVGISTLTLTEVAS